MNFQKATDNHQNVSVFPLCGTIVFFNFYNRVYIQLSKLEFQEKGFSYTRYFLFSIFDKPFIFQFYKVKAFQFAKIITSIYLFSTVSVWRLCSPPLSFCLVSAVSTLHSAHRNTDFCMQNIRHPAFFIQLLPAGFPRLYTEKINDF